MDADAATRQDAVVRPQLHALLTTIYFLLPTMTTAANNLSPPSSMSSSSSSNFLWFSDLHYDPFYGTSDAFPQGDCQKQDAYPLGQYGCDSSSSLIDATLQAAKRHEPDPDFIIVTGDFCRHGSEYFDDPREGVRSILEQVSKKFNDTFPGKIVVPSLGNDDFTPDYYLDLTETSNNNDLLNMAADAFSEYLLYPHEVASMRLGGYLARNLTDTLTVLSLNTIPYSSKHLPSNQVYIQDPFDQFAWMTSQLRTARRSQRRVYIVGHIAPTIGSYRQSQLWHDDYMDRYFGIVDDFRDVVTAQLFGHIHSDEFRVLPHMLSSENDAPPLLLGTSVTPIFTSNPSFRLVTYDTDGGDIIDYDTYYLNLTATGESASSSSSSSPPPEFDKLPSFREDYHVPDLSVSSLHEIVTSLGNTTPSANGNAGTAATAAGDDGATRMRTFLSRLHVGTLEGECDAECQLSWSCTLQAATKQDYWRCLHATKKKNNVSPSGPFQKNGALRDANNNVAAWTIFASLLVAGVIFGVAVTAYQRKRRRREYEVPGSEEQGGMDDGGNVVDNSENEII